MDFQLKVLLLSFATTAVLAIIIVPILRRLKVGQLERDDGPESHLQKQGTPTMGGVIMEISTVIACAGIYIYYRRQDLQVANNLLPLLFVTLGFGLIGFIDDFKKLVLKNTKGLKPAYKMLGLLIVAVGFTLYLTQVLHLGTQTYIPFFKVYIDLPLWFYIPFTIFVLLSCTNAINLTDGVDGLATSITTIIITCLTVIGIILDVQEIAIFGSIMIGACLGFLLFNLHPAKVFMGDTGSLMLGGIIAGLAIYLKMPLLIVIVALIPILETLSVMIQVTYFKKTGKRVFKMAPLHHHFELSGWNENKVVSIFSVITLVLCVVALFAI